MRTTRYFTAMLSACVLAGSSSTLYAQQDDAIVVSATRFSQDARKLPASVAVLREEDIAQSAAKTLPELLAEQVGITLKDFYGNNAALTSIDLRGFGVTGGQNTLVLLDGRRVTDIDLSSAQWSAIPLSAIERIEILRGTGSVLYGEGASAGVINIVTHSPLKQGAQAELRARAGSHNMQEGQLAGSVTSANFGFRASAYGFGSDGYRANNRNEQANYSASLRWDQSDSTIDLLLARDSQDLRLPGARRIQPSIALDEYAADRRGAQTPLDYASRDGARAGLTLTHRVGDAELKLGIDHRDKDQRSYFDQQGFPIYRADALDVTSLTPRMRIPLRLGALVHRLTLGIDAHNWRYDSRRANLPQNVARPINRVRASQHTAAFYLQDAIQLTSATGLVLGWRQERTKISAQDTLDATAPGFFFNTAAGSAAETQKQHAWELGLKHALGARWSAFVRANRSYRFVNVDEIYENDAFFSAQFQILRPQHAITREAGAEWRGGSIALRAALFRSDVSDEIHLDPFTAGVGNTNLPPSRRQGVELHASWRPGTAVQLSAGYAYTDAKFREGVLPGSLFAIGTNLDIAGKKVPLVPQHKLDLGFVWNAAARTRLSGALSYVSSQYMDNDEPNTLGARIPAYTLVNLKAAHDLGFGRIAFAINNLFDRQYFTYGVRSAFTADRYAVYPLPGRSVALSLEMSL